MDITSWIPSDLYRLAATWAKCKEATRLRAALNGLSAIWPQAEAVSDGRCVQFYCDDVPIFDCNAEYASAHFLWTKCGK